MDSICNFCHWWEGFGFSSLEHCPWVSVVLLSPAVCLIHPLEFAPKGALEDLGLPQGRVGMEVAGTAWLAVALAAVATQGIQWLGQQGIWCF